MSYHPTTTVEVALPGGQCLPVVGVERLGQIDLASFETGGHLVIIDDSDQDSGDLLMAVHCLRLATGDRGMLSLVPAGDLPATVQALVMPCELAVRLAAAENATTVFAVGRVSHALVSACVLVASGLTPPAAIQAVTHQLPEAEFDLDAEVAVSVFHTASLQRAAASAGVLP